MAVASACHIRASSGPPHALVRSGSASGRPEKRKVGTGADSLNLARSVEHDDVLVRIAAEPGGALKVERFQDSAGDTCFVDRHRGEPDPDQAVLALHAKRTRGCLENDRIG